MSGTLLVQDIDKFGIDPAGSEFGVTVTSVTAPTAVSSQGRFFAETTNGGPAVTVATGANVNFNNTTPTPSGGIVAGSVTGTYLLRNAGTYLVNVQVSNAGVANSQLVIAKGTNPAALTIDPQTTSSLNAANSQLFKSAVITTSVVNTYIAVVNQATGSNTITLTAATANIAQNNQASVSIIQISY